MRAYIKANGTLELAPDNDLEEYAIKQWLSEVVNGGYRENRTPEMLLEKIKVIERI